MELILIVLGFLCINFLIAKLLVQALRIMSKLIVLKYNNDQDFKSFISDDVYAFSYEIYIENKNIDYYPPFHFPVLNLFILIFILLALLFLYGKR